MPQRYLMSLLGSIMLGGAAFLPWLRLGEVGLAGVPDPAGYFVIALGVVGLLLSLVGLRSRRDTRQWLVLVAIAGVTTLVIVWRTGPETIAERAYTRAQAVALVDQVAFQPPPPVGVGSGLIVGLAGGLIIAATCVSRDRG